MHTRRLSLVDTAERGAGPEAGAHEATLKIAIATNDHRYLDAHFGSARSFGLFEVGATGWRFVEMVSFDDTTEATGQHRDDVDHITPKVEALDGTDLLFVRAIGGPAAAKVVAAGIHPIKVKEPEPLGAVVLRVQRMLSGNPPPWLRKRLQKTARTPDFIDDAVEAEPAS